LPRQKFFCEGEILPVRMHVTKPNVVGHSDHTFFLETPAIEIGGFAGNADCGQGLVLERASDTFMQAALVAFEN